MEKVCIYGDSISSPTHGNGGYIKWLRKKCPTYEITNFAVPSSSLTRNSNRNMQELMDEGKLPSREEKIIIIWHGSNDWYWGAPKGSFTGENEACFQDSIKVVISKLRQAAPLAKIIWITPIYRDECPHEVTRKADIEYLSPYSVPNKVGRCLLDYRNDVQKAGELYSFDVLDINSLLQIHSVNAERFLEDNVHPNELGCENIALILAKKIKSLLEISTF